MTNIHFPVDGQGTQSLKKQNTNDKSSFHVDATSPDSKNQKNNPDKNKTKLKNQQTKDNTADTPENKESVQETRRDNVARTPNRRQKNRRKENTPIILNTRSEQDRRKSAGQREDDLTDHDEQFGIDTKA